MGGDGQVLLTVRRYYRCISAKVLRYARFRSHDRRKRCERYVIVFQVA